MTTLSQQLSLPLTSTQQLKELLVPYLDLLQLIPDRLDLITNTSITILPNCTSSSLSEDRVTKRNTFLKRQLGLVQKTLIESVWSDWEDVFSAEAEDGSDLVEVLFERWFIPPLPSQEVGDDRDLANEIAISSYAILNSLLLQPRSNSKLLRKESLIIITRLLSKLTSIYAIDLLYPTIFKSTSFHEEVVDEEEEERSITKASAKWDLLFRDIYTIPAKLSNAWGRIWELQPSSVNLAEVIPTSLEWSYHCSAITTSYVKLLILLSTPNSTSTQISISISSLALPLLSFPPSFYTSSTSSSDPQSRSFFQNFLTNSLPTLLPSFPSSPLDLLIRKNFLKLWREILDELTGSDLERLFRGLIKNIEERLVPSRKKSREIVKRGIIEIVEKEEDDEEEKKKEELLQRQKIKGGSFLSYSLLGPLVTTSDNWKIVISLLVEPRAIWSRGIASILPRWVESEGASDKEREWFLVELLENVMKVWADPDSIKLGNESSRIYLTTLLLLVVLSLPPCHSSLLTLSHSKSFLKAISSHLSLLKPTTRYLGMLTAEIISTRTIKVVAGESGTKALSFGSEIWEGEGEGKDVIGELRSYLDRFEKARSDKVEGWQKVLLDTWSTLTSPPAATPSPRKKIAVSSIPTSTPPVALKRPLISLLDPDDLQPYPLPAAPSSNYLDLLNSSDPSLYASALPSTSGTSTTRKRGKLRAPVYIPELVAYLKGKDVEGGAGIGGAEEKEDEMAERVEVGLKEGEGLIRKKQSWGGELAENSVDLAFALMGLQDVYELENFDIYKQNMLTALVFCCPTLVAPAMIEQYFSRHYTSSQRYMILTALALGARELAGLPTIAPSQIANTTTTTPQIDLFPSKRLPPALHRKLIGSQPSITPTIPRGLLEDLTAELTREALLDAKEEAETTLPLAAKEKLLTVRRFASAPSSVSKSNTQISNQSLPSYPSIASEYFILPLINRFWLYLRDSATSPSTNSNSPYSGGRSTPTLLEPLILSKYLGTLSVLLHASRHSPHFLAVLVPEVLELLLSLRVSPEESDESVLGSQMELILTALDSSVLIDGGRTLMGLREGRGAELVGECKDWAELVFEQEEMKGGDGKGEGIGRVGRAAAGVLLRIEEIFSRWRGRVGY